MDKIVKLLGWNVELFICQSLCDREPNISNCPNLDVVDFDVFSYG